MSKPSATQSGVMSPRRASICHSGGRMPADKRRFPVLLDPYAETCEFPDVALALSDPPGLLAVGGSLASEWLLQAYRRGIFPWYEAGQPILWWSPDPRTAIEPGQVHVSRSMRKLLNRRPFTVSTDRAFSRVMRACAAPRAEIGRASCRDRV